MDEFLKEITRLTIKRIKPKRKVKRFNTKTAA